MPAPLDLAGRVFGRLTVLERAGRVKFGREQAAWRCRCTCGREEVLAQALLTKRGVQACAVCRQAACVVCSRPVPLERGMKNTCSDACAAEKTRATQLDYYYRRVQADPDHNIQAHARRAERLATDPQRLRLHQEREQARSRRRWQEVADDPARRQAQRDRARAWYAAHAPQVQADRRAALEALDEAAFAARAERLRHYSRAYAARWRESLRRQPELHQAFLDTQRIYLREYKRRRALQQLQAVGEQLQQRVQSRTQPRTLP